MFTLMGTVFLSVYTMRARVYVDPSTLAENYTHLPSPDPNYTKHILYSVTNI